MTMRELSQWLTFEIRHQPLPDRMFDMHLSMLASIVVNLAGAANQAKPADYTVVRDPHAAPPSSDVDEQMRNWRGG
jgi:hypothetical protein